MEMQLAVRIANTVLIQVCPDIVYKTERKKKTSFINLILMFVCDLG